MEDIMAMFAVLDDPRAANKQHDLMEVLMIALCASLCGAKSCVDMEMFARAREEDLKQFLTLKHGAPSHDTFSTIFRHLDPKPFEQAFSTFMKRFNKALKEQNLISVDGKALRRAFEKGQSYAPRLMVSAWGNQMRMVLGCKEAEDGNEAKAVLELFSLLDLKGAIVTADALHCRADTAEALIKKQADYVLALKGNQPKMFKEAQELFFNNQSKDYAQTDEVAHGRKETRRATIIEDKTLAKRLNFTGLRAIGRIESERTINGKTQKAVRFFVISKALDPATFLEIVRNHWDIENGQHWVLDMLFDEDRARNRKDHSPRNLALIRRLALNALRAEPTKEPLIHKTRKAAWSDCSYLFNLLSYMR